MGEFDEFRRNGFDIVATRLHAQHAKLGSYRTAEQAWKTLDKLVRRDGEIVAREAMRVLRANATLKAMLDQFPSALFQGTRADWPSTTATLEWDRVLFPNTGKRVHLKHMLGKGGMGGAVYLGESDDGRRYAVKRFLKSEHAIAGFQGQTARSRLDKTEHHLTKYLEAARTPNCVDALIVGRDEYLLLELGEGTLDYSTLGLSDLVSVFEDLRKLYAFSQVHMREHIAQDFGVLHLDIHGENMMRFDGKLRLIDFGGALLFSHDQDDRIRAARPIPYDRNNPDLYLQDESLLERRRAFYNPDERGTWAQYIDDWRQTVGASRYAGRKVARVGPQQYGCVVLTAVLIKEMWAAMERGRDLGMGGKPARAIRNVHVYSQAHRALQLIKGEALAPLIELLMRWFDEMMRRLFEDEPFSAVDAIKFFGGVQGQQASRQRTQSASL